MDADFSVSGADAQETTSNPVSNFTPLSNDRSIILREQVVDDPKDPASSVGNVKLPTSLLEDAGTTADGARDSADVVTMSMDAAVIREPSEPRKEQITETPVRQSPIGEVPTHKDPPKESEWNIGGEVPAESAPATNDRPLNVGDALSYLDSVKRQFADSPWVYNRFLDIMKDFKNQAIDTPGVIERVSRLFYAYPVLIEGFNTFLPAGYRIECQVSKSPTMEKVIRVTTPSGSLPQSLTIGASTRNAGPSTVSFLEEVLPRTNTPYTCEDMSPALESVAKIKQCFEGRADQYQEFLDVLGSYRRSPMDQELASSRIAKLFQDSPDLLSGLQDFMPRDMLAALDSVITAEKDARGPKQGRKRPAETGSTSTGSSAQKRKRRAPDRDKDKGREREREKESERDKEKGKDKDRENEATVRVAQSKTKRSKYQQSFQDTLFPDEMFRSPPSRLYNMATFPAPKPGASAFDRHSLIPQGSRDEVHFFDRVRQAIDNREVYNEFLKLINLFTQEIIDMRKLVEQSRSYLTDDLFRHFKEILGYDSSWENNNSTYGYMNGANGLNPHGTSEGMEHLSKEGLSVRCGPSYRRLPASEANVSCSGRDDMCKSVLNDEWVSHPTWASEDSGFIAHKKNAYEEALHRSEEERHEYDFHIEAITRTIATLEPYHMKFVQMSQEERAASKQKLPLSGVNKAIHQRIIKKIYGREAGLEVIQTVYDSPAIAIPVVHVRLKQKEQEWKKAQREWNKVWREIDARNYQKSLDHQGITFKANDKKTITMKTFVNQIESVREEQMSKRASLIDPLFARTRPRYQMAFVMEDIHVLEDLFKLTFSFLDRMSHHINSADRRRIEGFLRCFIPMFFMLDPMAFNAALQNRKSPYNPEQLAADDFANFIDETDETAGVSGLRFGRSGRRGGAGSDLRKKILKTGAPDKSASRRIRELPISDALVQGFSEPAPPHPLRNDMASPESRIESIPPEQMLETSSSREVTPERPVRRASFFANATMYTLLRLIELLYSRLLTCKTLSAKLASDPSSPYLSNSLAAELALLDSEPPDPKLKEMLKGPSPASHFYEFLLESCERLFDNLIDQLTFEEIARYMFGTKAYILFTVDKVIGAIIKQVQNILADGKSLILLEGLKRERETPLPTSLDLDEIRTNAEKAIGPEENLFRIDWAPNSQTMTIQLLGKDDASFDDYDVYTGRWQAYIDSFVSDKCTRGLSETDVKPPFLKRNERAVNRRPLESACLSRSGLEIKVCVRTYRMFFVSQTEDFLWRHWTSEDREGVSKRLDARAARSQQWMERLNKEDIKPR